MIQSYFKKLYHRTMSESYAMAYKAIANTLLEGGHCLDCGANKGTSFYKIKDLIGLNHSQYIGIEWTKYIIENSCKIFNKGNIILF